MRARLLNLPAAARSLGFALVAIAIVATALHLPAQLRRAEPSAADAPAVPDALAEELKRCQLIADRAKDGPACEAAWAESRHRFFTYAPTQAGTPASPTTNTSR